MKLYRELAEWWQLFSPVEEYADEAASFIEILQENCQSPCRTVLELGAGAGSNAFYLKDHFEMLLVDLSTEMLAESQAINPELEHLQGDMRFVRLDRQFDAVFIHDAICYMKSEDDLRQAIETAFFHCKPGGTTVVAPDFVRETFKPLTEHDGRDGSDGRAMRWLMWTFKTDADNATYTVHFAFLLKTGEVVRIEHDWHIEGLFARQTWLRLFEQTGFQKLKIIVDLYGREVFVAGATGTIGLPLVRELVKRNHEVTGLTRSKEKCAILENAGASAAVADALDLAELKAAVMRAAPDCVIHLLTAIPANGAMRASDMRETNRLRIEGTKNLLAAAIAANAKRIVAESMVFVYGFKHASDEILTEQSAIDSIEEKPWLQEAADALRSLEAQLTKAGRDGSIESIALRYGLFYGAESPSTRYLFKMIKKRFLPTIKGTRGISPFVHLDDAVSATVAVVEKEKVSSVYNIVDDEAVEMNVWIAYAAKALQAKKPFAIPLWLLRLFSPYTAAMLDSSVVVSNAKARNELGWQPKFSSYQQGLKQAVEEADLLNKLQKR